VSAIQKNKIKVSVSDISTLPPNNRPRFVPVLVEHASLKHYTGKSAFERIEAMIHRAQGGGVEPVGQQSDSAFAENMVVDLITNGPTQASIGMVGINEKPSYGPPIPAKTEYNDAKNTDIDAMRKQRGYS
jgi:hypothetical protein